MEGFRSSRASKREQGARWEAEEGPLDDNMYEQRPDLESGNAPCTDPHEARARLALSALQGLKMRDERWFDISCPTLN